MPCPSQWQPELACLSHEVRTHVHGILGLVGCLRAGRLPRAQQSMVRRLEAGGRALLTLANAMLEPDRGPGGTESRFVPAEIAEDTAALLAPLAERRGVELICAADPERHAALGDASRFRQLVANLVGNAVKFTERGQIVVQLEARRKGGRVHLRLTVADTGIGIATADQRRIFRPGEQVRPGGGGSGLGLGIARAAAESLGGGLRLLESSDKGSTFVANLRLRAGETPRLAPPRARPCIIVGGQPAQRRWLARHFLRWNIPCAEATIGNLPRVREAFRRATDERPLVLVDIPVGARELPEATTDTIVLHPLGLDPGNRPALAKPLRGDELRDLLSPGVRAGRGAVTAQAWRILLVDDDPASRLVATRQLRRRGHRITAVTGGRQALRHLRRREADLVVLDLNLPDIPGLELAAMLRRDKPGLPLLALTAHGGPEVRAGCLRAGFTAHLAKPSDEATLTEVVERLAEAGEDHRDRAAARVILLRGAREECRRLEAAERSGRTEAIGQAAHRTRGALMAAGLGDLAKLAARAERQAREGRAHAAARTLAKVSGGLRRLADDLTSE